VLFFPVCGFHFPCVTRISTVAMDEFEKFQADMEHLERAVEQKSAVKSPPPGYMPPVSSSSAGAPAKSKPAVALSSAPAPPREEIKTPAVGSGSSSISGAPVMYSSAAVPATTGGVNYDEIAAMDPYEFVQQTPGALFSAAGTPALESDLQIHAHATARQSHKEAQEAAKAAQNITGKKRKNIRVAAGKTWEDKSLDEWPENDFRIFCGDLGNECNDNTLAKAFAKYPSFAKAKVIREKTTSRSKGFGFVSFLDPYDCANALKEMNGKYVGNRPVKLRKSTHEERDLAQVRKKAKKTKSKKTYRQLGVIGRGAGAGAAGLGEDA